MNTTNNNNATNNSSKTTITKTKRKRRNNKRKQVVPLQTQQRVVAMKVGQANKASNALRDKAFSYMRCRLNPFDSTGSEGLPDGSSVRRLVKDIRVFYDVVIGTSGAVQMYVMPEIPHGIMFKDISPSTTGLIVNGQSVTGPYQGVGTAGGWYAPTQADWVTWASTAATTDTLFNPWGATRARLVTQAARIIYTGKVVDCAGTITVLPVDLSAEETNVMNRQAVQRMTPTGATNGTFAINTVELKDWIVGNSVTTLVPGAVTLGSSEGALMVLKRNNIEAAHFQSMASPFILGELGQVATLCDVGTVGNATALYDATFSSCFAVIRGATPGSTYRIEVVQCVEFGVGPTSPLTDFTKVPMPLNDKFIKLPEQILSNMPIAGNLSFGDKLMNAIKQYGPTALSLAQGVAKIML